MNRRFRPLILLLLSWVLMLSCCAGEPPPAPLSDFLGKLGYVRVELKRFKSDRLHPGQGNDLYLDVRVDGKKQKWQLDTGFSITCLDHAVGKRYKTLAELHHPVEDPVLGRIDGADFVLIRQLQVGPVRMTNQPALVKDIEKHIGWDERAGVMGIDLLRRNHAVLDFLGKGLFLRAEKPDYKTAGAFDEMMRRSGWDVISLTSDRSLCPIVETQIRGRPLRLVVDSGCEFTQLDLSVALRLGLKLDPTHMRINGIEDRSSKAYSTTVPLLQLAGVALTNEPVVIADIAPWQSKDGPRFDGMIGADWLAFGNGVLDCQAGRLYLKPFSRPKK